MSEDWEKMFTDLDREVNYYPGSKRKRRDPKVIEKPSKAPVSEDWASKPLIKVINGKNIEFFTIGSLARALNKSEVSVRLWIRKGYLPTEPYRLPATKMPDGKVVPGRRLYTREMIESARESFAGRGLLDTPRIEWRDHPDLAQEIRDSWTAIKTDIATSNQ